MSAQATISSRLKTIAKSKWSWLSTLILVLLGVYAAIQISSAIDKLKYGLTPPELPAYKELETVFINEYGCGPKDETDEKASGCWEENSDWFHHASQGTATLPIPYDWLVALEQPKSSPWWIFLGSEDLFVGEYLLRHGFISQTPSAQNPDGLPIGIAKTPSMYFPGMKRKATAAGFTCAACHTGQLVHDGKRYVVDGGPAMTDLGLLTRSLGAALGQTALSSKFSLFNGRFERFAKRVLGSNYNVITRSNLKEELNATLALLVEDVDAINVTEGFTRLDALNRIGNQVFSTATNNHSNYSPIEAPVNYPHIWTTSWFDWVQYDGSIMQPLIRNAGEALGVQAYVDTKGPDAQRFASSVDYPNLVKIESWLAGTDPTKDQKFNGLLAPKWPEEFPPIDSTLASHGEKLYDELCQGCHLPPIDTPDFWSEKHWGPINYVQNGEPQATEQAYLKLKILPLEKIGTDTAQADVLTSRTVDSTGLNLNTEVCTQVVVKDDDSKTVLKYVALNDSATSNFGLALGALVNRTNQQWFNQNYTPEFKRPKMEGERPNCLQVGQGYKARPLNGIWATAPFLHNGSIPNIYALLSPMDERPTFVELGNKTFDTENLGIEQTWRVKHVTKKFKDSYKLTPDYDDSGLFILDTREPGNHNTGHLFVDDKVAGRIGRGLQHEEKMALIEYLKTL